MIKVLVLLFLSMPLFAQRSIELVLPSGQIMYITDEPANLARLYPAVDIFNHKMEFKSKFPSYKGIPIRELLKDVKLGEESPKFLSEYYLVVEATDGYKVTYSWNEVFNQKGSEQIVLVTESKSLEEDLPIILNAGDIASGRRFVKNVKRIRIWRV
ncbi:hypothetical protein [Leadbetterella byssophila]|uniref:hypothetical protein n=1 Tax=Leadbetterella byssophila TaxID=316068 RepID=UPI0039A04744